MLVTAVMGLVTAVGVLAAAAVVAALGRVGVVAKPVARKADW